VIAALTVAYLACFTTAAVPGIARILKRRSSGDCSLWREGLVFVGVCLQLAVFIHEGASPYVLASPITSGVSIGTLIAVTLRFR
jgi:hypothetical protein